MNCIWLISCLLLLFTVPTLSASSVFPHLRFQSWYPAYSNTFQESSVVVCNETLQAYLQSQHTWNKVADHADCVLRNTTETIKVNMASAGVILGLMPASLGVLGPTFSELSILMLERPLLAMLLALSAPAVWSSRPFEASNPLEVLKQSPQRWCGNPTRWTRQLRAVASLLQYMLALGAATNVVTASLELGMKTVLVWKKSESHFPLIWVLLTMVIHLAGVMRLYRFLRTTKVMRENPYANLAHTFMRRP